MVLGIVMFSSEAQPWNAKDSIRVMPSGIVTLISDVQSLNALSPIVVTEFGMVIEDKLLH
jgi:hypothetical protein